jgi:hypothetical protein
MHELVVEEVVALTNLSQGKERGRAIITNKVTGVKIEIHVSIRAVYELMKLSQGDSFTIDEVQVGEDNSKVLSIGNSRGTPATQKKRASRAKAAQTHKPSAAEGDVLAALQSGRIMGM